MAININHTSNDVTSTTTSMSLVGLGGSVGIGTTAPASGNNGAPVSLHIVRNTFGRGVVIEQYNATEDASVWIRGLTAGGSGYVKCEGQASTTSVALYATRDSADGNIPASVNALWGISNHPLVFGAGNTERYRIDNNGYSYYTYNSTSLGVGGITYRTATSNDSFITFGVSTSLSKAFVTTSQNGSGTAYDFGIHVGGSSAEAFRVTTDKVLVCSQPTPATANATGTLTIANLKTAIITSTATNNPTNLTLPTGTLSDGGFTALVTDMAFDWVVINTGANSVVILAGTAHTIVGSATVTAATTGRFRSRRTGTNTWVTYRM